MESFTYHFSLALNLKKLRKIALIRRRYTVNYEKGEVRACSLLDTFDNELMQTGRLLLQTEDALVVLHLKTGQFAEQTVRKKWSFVSDLSEGPVSRLLADVSPLRTLSPVTVLKMQKGLGSLLDDERKTRVRFVNLTLHNGTKNVTVGSSHELRGYSGAHKDLKQGLLELGALSCHSVRELYTSLEIVINDYNPKPRLQLVPQDTIKKNTTIIIETFLLVARANEEGVIADIDTEFLHDYRVSFRKIRSVLSLFKGVYSKEDTSRLKDEFSALMQKTNKLRDLDVYLLNKDDYYSLVPATTHDGLAILFAGFDRERKAEYTKVVTVIKSKMYCLQLKKLQTLFENGDNIQSGSKNKEHTRDFACRIILKRYRNVCKIARSIDATTKDEIVHQLRIHCKKLRYLMEFFTTLFPANDIKQLIKALKRLQDNLGRFNDYSVQQVFLKDVLARQSVDKVKGIKVAESTGALTAMLHRRQNKERKQVMRNFKRFDGPEIRESFDKLFGTEVIANENPGLLQ
jgi:CHAD domain-containing protein